jgi:hypothetical protein
MAWPIAAPATQATMQANLAIVHPDRGYHVTEP